MAKDLTRHQQGIVNRYYEHHETIQSNKISDLVAELWLAGDPKTQTKLWSRAQVALMRMGIDANHVANIVKQRDIEAFAALVGQVHAGKTPTSPTGKKDPSTSEKRARGAISVSDGRTIGQMRTQLAAESGQDSLEEPNLKRALKAFRRKIKSLRREDESKIGSRYVTMGRESNICAITPPSNFPMTVWNKLAELGRLKKAGSGTFELP